MLREAKVMTPFKILDGANLASLVFIFKNYFSDMKKFHNLPLTEYFTKGTKAGVQYNTKDLYIRFENNVIIIMPVYENEDGIPDTLIDKLDHILKKYKPKYLKKVELHLKDCSLKSHNTLFMLGSLLKKRFKQVKELSLHFSNCPTSPSGFESLIAHISTLCKGITSLALHLNSLTNLKNSAAKYINRLLIPRLSHLCSLSFNSLEGHEFCDDERFPIETVFKKAWFIDLLSQTQDSLPSQVIKAVGASALCVKTTNYLSRKLSKLSLAFPNQYWPNSVSLSGVWKTLKVLRLNFETYSNKTVQDLTNILSSIATSFPCLEFLTLTLYEWVEKPIAVLEVLSQTIPKLKGLAIQYYDYESLENEDLMPFFARLCILGPNLEELAVHFKGNFFKADQSLADYLFAYIPSLKKLSLGLQDISKGTNSNTDSEISKRSLEQFDLFIENPNYKISTSILGLKSLSVSLRHSCSKDSLFIKENLYRLLQENAKTLKELILHLDCKSDISDENVPSLDIIESLPFPNLEHFTLILGGYKNKSIPTLLKCLNCKFIKIKSLRILIRYLNNNIKGMQKVFKHIAKNMVDLEELHFEFESYEKTDIEPGIYEKYCEIVKTLRKLKILKLKLHDPTWGQNAEFRRSLLNHLKYIPSVTIC